MTRPWRWGCLVAIVAVPLVWIWATGYLDGWNLVPPMRGVVVDAQTGQPLAGARVWRWWVRDEVGGARLSPGGFNTGYPSASVEVTTDNHGEFKVGGLVALHAVTGMGLAVYMPGYALDSFEQVGKLEYRRHGTRVWRKGLKLRVEVRMKRLGRGPQAWAAHLGAIDSLTRYGYPLPRDLILDEAYRYISQGGEITEGTARLLRDYLPSSPCPTPFCHDPRTVCTAAALVQYCESHRSSEACWFSDKYVPYLREYVSSEGGCHDN